MSIFRHSEKPSLTPQRTLNLGRINHPIYQRFFVGSSLSFLLFSVILLTPLKLAWSKGNKVINGQTVQINSSSTLKQSTVALMSIRKDHYDAFCTGSLISSNVIVTAAHCLHEKKEEDVYVAFGPLVNTKLENNKYLYKSKKFYVHENYLRDDEDIGLIVLDRDVHPDLKPIPLISNKEITQDKLLIHVTGFSTYNQKDKNNLFESFALDKNRSYVEHYQIDRNGNKVITLETKELVQIKNQSIDKVMMLNQFDGGLCPGDSGGPATFALGDRHYLLGLNTAVGSKYLTSHEEFDCEYISKITLVAPYLSWIKEKISATSLKEKSFSFRDLKLVQASSRKISCQKSIEDILNLYQDEITFDFYINIKCQKMDAHLKLVDQLTSDCFSRCEKEDKMHTFCDFAARGNRIIKEQTNEHCLVRSH